MISEEMCTTIKSLFEKGYNISQIARMLNIDRKTVRKKLNENNAGNLLSYLHFLYLKQIFFVTMRKLYINNSYYLIGLYML